MKLYNFTQRDTSDTRLKIIRNTCLHCREENRIYVEPNDYLDWLSRARFVQDIWPTLSQQHRELIISGSHPECWNEMFPDEDE
jgi:hypothetical protein